MMQGSFPGTDPYLEEPALRTDVHSGLIVAISEALASSVVPGFSVRIEQRMYTADAEESVRQGVVRPPILGAILAGIYARACYALSADYTGAVPLARSLPPEANGIAARLRAARWAPER